MNVSIFLLLLQSTVVCSVNSFNSDEVRKHLNLPKSCTNLSIFGVFGPKEQYTSMVFIINDSPIKFFLRNSWESQSVFLHGEAPSVIQPHECIAYGTKPVPYFSVPYTAWYSVYYRCLLDGSGFRVRIARKDGTMELQYKTTTTQLKAHNELFRYPTNWPLGRFNMVLKVKIQKDIDSGAKKHHDSEGYDCHCPLPDQFFYMDNHRLRQGGETFVYFAGSPYKIVNHVHLYHN